MTDSEFTELQAAQIALRFAIHRAKVRERRIGDYDQQREYELESASMDRDRAREINGN